MGNTSVIEKTAEKTIEELQNKVNALEDELFRYKLYKLRATTHFNTRKCANALMIHKGDYNKAADYLKELAKKDSVTL